MARWNINPSRTKHQDGEDTDDADDTGDTDGTGIQMIRVCQTYADTMLYREYALKLNSLVI